MTVPRWNIMHPKRNIALPNGINAPLILLESILSECSSQNIMREIQVHRLNFTVMNINKELRIAGIMQTANIINKTLVTDILVNF